jgi:hypothetical protein
MSADMGKLLTAEVDSCQGWGTTLQMVQLPTVPAPGELHWFLVLGANGATFPIGTAGAARVGGSETARIVDSSSGCQQ